MGKPAKRFHGALRPMPPESIGRFFGEHPVNFMPATAVLAWVKETFLMEGSKLYNADHNHLVDANFNFLWAAGGFTKQMRRVIGMTEEVTFRCGPWQKARQEQQMHEWFGLVYPDYLITLDAYYCSECSDAEFCALVEHELYHIGQQLDAFGAPKFHRSSGLPMLCIRGHDVEEFIGVVRRYGAGDPEGSTSRFIEAAKKSPEIGHVDIARACGTCLLKAA